ncbi:hypothetical protein AGMMS49579_02160 [Spirochaetia bacterium]|nr:hypothetical protein AGMMS49579_02110 [Spirochaetia bacterium]GHV49732.1 hypothetical protein AGMMS49579_02160 [Spirochaetia bacterium]
MQRKKGDSYRIQWMVIIGGNDFVNLSFIEFIKGEAQNDTALLRETLNSGYLESVCHVENYIFLINSITVHLKNTKK